MAGQDAELQLKVSLDLAFFRQQLSTIGAQLGGQSLQLNVQFNKKSIADQYRLLDRYVRGRKFNVELNLVGGLTKNEFEKIKGRLDDLRELRKIEIPVSIKNGATGKEVQQTIVGIKDRIGSNQQIRQGGGKLRIATSIKPSITNADISDFKRAVREKLSGISVKIKAQVEGGASFAAGPTGLAGLQEYMRSQGLSGGNMPGAASVGRRAQFENAVANANAKELQRMMRQADVAGRSKLTTKAQMQDALSKISEAAMESILGSMQMKMRDPLPIKRGFLDQIARAVFWMAGVDPAYLRQQAAQRRALPAIDFPAVVPQRNFPIGPSSTGRALPPGAIPQGLPGTAFAKQKYLPTALGEETKKILRDAANAFLDAIRQGVRTVKVRDLGAAVSRQPLLRPSGLAGLLSAGVGREPSRYATGAIGGESREQMMARRTAEAYARSALRGVSVMSERQPALPGTTFMGDAFVSGGGRDRVRGGGQAPERGGALGFRQSPLTSKYFENAQRYSAALEIARATSARFTASQLPLVGGLKEVASEFGFAIKQVFLFGAAYKALAFVQRLPGQILDAAKSQQQYSNALQTATQDTGTFAKELLYVDNVQRAFGLNLETTRSGFVRLYASMAPANFDSGSIEKLFTGISAATAALQLTPDKAERVIYAFGQMASKGQIMSEELKGQLGDVLPGALAIFAKAAGMSVKEFSKAMEDGVFVGGKFREVFANVSDELMTRFGTGAQAAGKSLQGLLNTVGGDFQRTLESFAPLANIAAQAVLGPLGNALRQLSTSAQIAMGEMERVQGQLGAARQDVLSLREGGASASQIRAAEQNVVALEARYRSLNEALKDPAVAKQVKDIQLLVQELSKAGVFVMNVAKTIGSILAPALNFLGTNLTSVIATITAFYVGFQTARLAAMALMGVLLLYRGLSALLGFGAAGQQAIALAGAFNVLGVAATRATTQMVGLRLALTALVASTVVGAVVAGIVMIAGAFATMSDKAKDAAQSSRDAAKAAIDAAQAGNVAGAAMSVQTVLNESRKAAAARKALQSIYARATPEQKRGATPMTISSQESVALQGTALTSGMIQAGVSRGGARQIRVPSELEMRTLQGQFGNLAGQQAIDLREAKEATRQAEKVNRRLGLNKPMPGPAAPGAPLAEDEKRTRQKERESQVPVLELELATTQQMFELEKQMMTARLGENELEVVRLNGLKEQLQFNEKIAKIKLDADLPAAEKALQIQRIAKEAELSRLQTNFDLETKILETYKKVQDALVDIGKKSAMELEDKREYTKLVMEGVLPSTAKITVEVRRQFAIEAEKLNLLQTQIRDQITSLEVKKNLTKEDQAQRDILLDILRQRLKETSAGMQELPALAGETIQSRIQSEGLNDPTVSMRENIADLEKEFARLSSWQNQAVEGSKAIGAALGEAMTTGVASLVSGTATAQEVFAKFLQSVGQALLQAASQMIATYIAIGVARIFAGLGSSGAFKGNASIQGGGFGSFSAGAPSVGGVPSLPGLEGAGALTSASSVPSYAGVMFANGGIARGGFRAFADGGIVQGPTLGLVGEGRYNEAVVPLPDGKSIPVQLGGSSSRDLISPSSGANVSPVLSMSFETTTINGVEYVSRDQLETAMMETRRLAAKDGANRGAALAIDRLQHSPNTRRRIGMR